MSPNNTTLSWASWAVQEANYRNMNLPISSYAFIHQRSFMEACGQTTKNFNLQQLGLYVGLCVEELKELTDAFSKIETGLRENKPIHRADVAEVLDAAGDLIVVAGGVAVSCGVSPEEILNRVWATNFEKVGPDGKVIRRSDGKIMKPAGWSPPSFTDLADKVLGNE